MVIIKTRNAGILLIVICLAAIAMADTGVPQVPETQGFATATAISAFGTATETDSIVSQMSLNNVLFTQIGILADPPLYYYDTALYTSSYTENTIADQGLVTYAKTLNTDTAGMAAENQFNVKAEKIVEFIGSDTGRMISDESNLVDGVGTIFSTGSIMLCPFAAGSKHFNPPFCNIVEEGSSVDLTIGSLSTATEERHIMQSQTNSILMGYDLSDYYLPSYDLPVSTPGVEVNYNIKLTGFGDIPATGTANAYMNVHVQEASTGTQFLNPFGPQLGNGNGLASYSKAEDLVYSESSTATGDIVLFDKVMNYDSKINGYTMGTPGALPVT